MRRFLLALIIFLLSLSALFAYTDSFSLYNQNSDWKSFFRAIKDDRGKGEVESLYEKYVSSSIDDIEKARAEYNMIRYLVDSGYKEEAEEHLENQRIIAESMEDREDYLAQVTKLDYISSRYYVTKELFLGMENSNLTKKIYSEYPDEVSIVITNAWRLIYTPQIAGGSNKNAIKILLPLLDEIEKISEEDLYSIYGALATAYYNRKDYVAAKEYLAEALDIFSGEKTILELKEKLDKK